MGDRGGNRKGQGWSGLRARPEMLGSYCTLLRWGTPPGKFGVGDLVWQPRKVSDHLGH